MLHTEHRRQLETRIETRRCELPADELAHLQDQLDRVAEAVGELPASLELTIIHHPRRDQYHAEAALQLPRRSLFTGQWNSYLDAAAQQCLDKLVHKIEAYMREPDREVDRVAARVLDMNQDIIAPESADEGELGQAARAQDYQRFRELLAGYEDWLRLRIGRWLQRYPEADAEVGQRLSIPDLVEEVFLNAFMRFDERPGPMTISDWLEDLIDPSLRALWGDRVGEGENIRQARTLRETPLD